MTDLRTAAQQALEALRRIHADPNSNWDCSAEIIALEAALAEPVQEFATTNIGCLGMPVNTPVTPPQTAEPVQEPLTIERLRDALVASRIIPPAAVEDPDEYDDGVTLFRIEALHRRIT